MKERALTNGSLQEIDQLLITTQLIGDLVAKCRAIFAMAIEGQDMKCLTLILKSVVS